MAKKNTGVKKIKDPQEIIEALKKELADTRKLLEASEKKHKDFKRLKTANNTAISILRAGIIFDSDPGAIVEQTLATLVINEKTDKQSTELISQLYSIVKITKDELEACFSDDPRDILEEVRLTFKNLGKKKIGLTHNIQRLIEMFNDKSRALRTANEIIENLQRQKKKRQETIEAVLKITAECYKTYNVTPEIEAIHQLSTLSIQNH